MDADAVIVPAGKAASDAFKAMGFSVFMTRATVGLAQVEVCQRAKRMTEVYWRWREKGVNTNISELLRELASVSDAVHKLQEAERKARGET